MKDEDIVPLQNDSFPFFFFFFSDFRFFFSVHMEACIDEAHTIKKQLKLGLVVKENKRRK